MIRLHDLCEASIWVWDGGLSRDDAGLAVRARIRETFVAEGWEHGPVVLYTLPLEHERVAGSGVFPPEQARHLNPYLVVAEARAVRRLPSFGSVTHDLTDEDLERLRRVVRRRFGPLSDAECDRTIDALVPETISKLVN